jgi:hypothetical protein
MKANELRIGNLLNHNNGSMVGSFIVGLIHLEDIIKENFHAREYEPIPLTEEWLLKMGFDISNSSGYNIKNNGIEIDIWFNDDGLINDIQISSTNISGAYPNIKHFQYVHQLQNLYFALTNEELTMK